MQLYLSSRKGSLHKSPYSSSAAKACFRSQMMSSAFSVPMERRIVEGVMFCSASSSAESWECEVVSWTKTSD